MLLNQSVLSHSIQTGCSAWSDVRRLLPREWDGRLIVGWGYGWCCCVDGAIFLCVAVVSAVPAATLCCRHFNDEHFSLQFAALALGEAFSSPTYGDLMMMSCPLWMTVLRT